MLKYLDMKIIQFLTEEDNILYGIIENQQEDTAYIIEGSIYEEFKISKKKSKIKKLLPPIYPPTILALGLNYRKHAEETGASYPDIPVMFIKGINTIIGPGDDIILPKIAADEVDYEAELAIIIGKKGKNIPPEKSMEYVLGFTCANDISARDWQMKKQKKQWARGKSFDTFCPIGPWIVSKEEVPYPNNLNIKTIINGKIYQDSNTSDMIFDIPSIISNLSQSMTLLPGTVILTGTPHGVGFTRNPPVFLKENDIITVSIENVGELTNRVKKES